MFARRKWVVGLVVVGVVVGVLVVVFPPEREPSYGGKRLSEWVRAPSRLPYVIAPMEPWPISRRRETEDAIEHIGTNGLPYLLKWIRYEPSAWKLKLYRMAGHVLSNPCDYWLLRDRPSDIATGAVMAFRTLGPEAKRAIPELSQVMNDPKRGVSAMRAASALGFLGTEAVPALVAGLTNQNPGVRLVISGRPQGPTRTAAGAMKARPMFSDEDARIFPRRLSDPPALGTNWFESPRIFPRRLSDPAVLGTNWFR